MGGTVPSGAHPHDLASSDFLKVLDRLSTKASEGLEDPNHTPGEGLQAWR